MNLDAALELMRKYGYSSTSVHPFIYKKGDTIGICYSYVDESYGILERVKFFDSLEIMEEFLKKITWVKENGKANNVRMILDNYETVDPKVIFLRNEKVMVKGEMEDISGFEARAAAQAKMDEVSKVILQAGNLLLVYDDLKNRQIEYNTSVIKLRNEVRQKYFDLQTLIDDYNGVKKNKEVKLLPEIEDASGINIMMETSAKDRYNQFKANHPTMEEAKMFVKDVWDLNSNLESNIDYYQKQAEENSIRNEERIVDAKLEYMKALTAKGPTLFKQDLKKAFKKINDNCKANSVELSNNFIQEKIASATKKYSYFDQLDFSKVSDYLRESIQNTNYGDLAIKYAKVDPSKVVPERKIVKLPLNEIAADLTHQYNEKLDQSEQAILTLYNSKFKTILDLILDIKDFSYKSISEIIKILNASPDFSKIKSECFDEIGKRLRLPLNSAIKNTYFANISFNSFEMFIKSIVNELKRLKSINNKMLLNSDLNLYFHIPNTDMISSKYFISLTNDINKIISQVNDNNELVALTLLKQDTPVLYSPYYLDFGNLYNKDNVEIKVSNVTIFEVLVDTSDVVVNVDENTTNVVRYFSEPKTLGNVSIVDEVQMGGKNVFCKLALTNNLANSNIVEEFANNLDDLNNDITVQGSTVAVAPVVEQPGVAPQPVETPPVQPVVVEPAPVVQPEPVQVELSLEPVQPEPVLEPVQPEPQPEPVVEPQVEVQAEPQVVEEPAPQEEEKTEEQVEEVKEEVTVSSDNIDDNKQSVDEQKESMQGLMSSLQNQVDNASQKVEEEKQEEVKEDNNNTIINQDIASVVVNKKDEDDEKFLDDLFGDDDTAKDEVKEEPKEEPKEENKEEEKEEDDDSKFLDDLLS